MYNRKLLQFVSDVKENKITAGDLIDLSDARGSLKIGEFSMAKLADALKHPNCPEALTIKLRGQAVSNMGVVLLCHALLSGKCKRGLQIDLSKTDVSIEWRANIAKLLKDSRYYDAETALQNASLFNQKNPLRVRLAEPLQDLNADPVSRLDFN